MNRTELADRVERLVQGWYGPCNLSLVVTKQLDFEWIDISEQFSKLTAEIWSDKRVDHCGHHHTFQGVVIAGLPVISF